jgi:hypothetical protein
MADQEPIKNENLALLHQQLVKDNYAIPADYAEFEKTFKDPANSKALFDQLTKDKYAIPSDYDSFVSTFELKKKDASDYGLPTKKVFSDMFSTLSKENQEVSKKPEEPVTPKDFEPVDPSLKTPEFTGGLSKSLFPNTIAESMKRNINTELFKEHAKERIATIDKEVEGLKEFAPILTGGPYPTYSYDKKSEGAQKREALLQERDQLEASITNPNKLDYFMGKLYSNTVLGLASNIYARGVSGGNAPHQLDPEWFRKYDANTLTDVAATTLGFLIDAPLFGMGGKIGSTVGKALAKPLIDKAMTQGVEKLVQSGIEKSLAEKMVLKGATKLSESIAGMTSAGTALGNYGFLQDALGQWAKPDADFNDIKFGQSFKRGAKDFVLGAGVGGLGVGSAAIAEKARMIENAVGRLGAQAGIATGGLTAESALFTYGGALLDGRNLKSVTGKEFLETAAMLGALKLSGAIQNPTETANNIYKSLKFNSGKPGEGDFEVDVEPWEINALNFKEPETVASALKKLSTDDTKLAEVLKDENVPALLKQKLLWGTRGVAMDKVNLYADKVVPDGEYVNIFNKDGVLVDRRKEASKEQAGQSALDLGMQLEDNKMQMRAAEPDVDRVKVITDLKNKGTDVPKLLEALDKPVTERTPEESKAVGDYYSMIPKEKEKPKEEAKVQSPEDIAKENNLEYQGTQHDESGAPVLDMYKRKDNQANLSVKAGSDASVVKAAMEEKAPIKNSLELGGEEFATKEELFKHLEENAIDKETGKIKEGWMNTKEYPNAATMEAINEWESTKKEPVKIKSTFNEETPQAKVTRINDNLVRLRKDYNATPATYNKKRAAIMNNIQRLLPDSGYKVVTEGNRIKIVNANGKRIKTSNTTKPVTKLEDITDPEQKKFINTLLNAREHLYGLDFPMGPAGIDKAVDDLLAGKSNQNTQYIVDGLSDMYRHGAMKFKGEGQSSVEITRQEITDQINDEKFSKFYNENGGFGLGQLDKAVEAGLIDKNDLELYKKYFENENINELKAREEWAAEEAKSGVGSTELPKGEEGGGTNEEAKARLRKVLIQTAVNEFGFTKATHGEEYWNNASEYVDHLLRTTGMENNLDVGEPVVYLTSLLEASNILDAVKGEPSFSIELKAKKTISETIDMLEEELPKYKGADQDVINMRIQVLEDYGEFIQDVIDNKLKPNEKSNEPNPPVSKGEENQLPGSGESVSKPVAPEGSQKPVRTTDPGKQSQIDVINNDADAQIAELEKASLANKKAKNKAVAEAQDRNGLFGDTKDNGEAKMFSQGEQGFGLSPERIKSIEQPYKEKEVEINKEIARLNKERESKIGEVLNQQVMQFNETPLEKMNREARELAQSKVDYDRFLRDINKQIKEPTTPEEKADLMKQIETTVEKAGYSFEVDYDEDPDFSSADIRYEGELVEPEQLPDVMRKLFDNYTKLLHESHENAIPEPKKPIAAIESIKPEDKPFVDYLNKAKETFDKGRDEFTKDMNLDSMIFQNLAGDGKKRFRQALMSYLKGEKVPIAKSGVTALKEEIRKWIDKQGTQPMAKNEELTLPDLSNKTVPELDNLISQLESGMKDILDQGDTERATKLNELIGQVIDVRNNHPDELKKKEDYRTKMQSIIKDKLDKTDEESLNNTVSKYGWSAVKNPEGYWLQNKDGKPVVKVVLKKGAYKFLDMSGTKLMDGRGEIEKSAEKLLKNYYYAEEIKPEKSKVESQGIPFKGKNYQSVEEVQDAFANGDLTFEEQKPLLEKVGKFEDGLKSEAQNKSSEMSKKLDLGTKKAETDLKKEVDDKLSIRFLPPDVISQGNTVIWKGLVKIRDGVADWIAGKLQKGMTSQTDALRWTSKAVTNWFGGLGRTEEDIMGKLKMTGTVKEFAPYEASQIRDKLLAVVNSDPESLRRVRDALDPEIAQEKLVYGDLTQSEKNLYFQLRDLNTWVHETNYANGFIPTETYLKYKDVTGDAKYIARMYDQFETMPPEVSEFIKRGNNSVQTKIVADIYKAREEVDDWKKEHAITDPTYLTAKRVMQTIQNVAVKDYMDQVSSQHHDLIRKVKAGEETPKGFTKLSGSYKWGDFRNRAVANHIVEDFTGFFYASHLVNTTYDAMKMFDRTKMNQFYKKFRTVYNPFVQLGNFTGNLFFSSIAGVNPVSLIGEMPNAIRDSKAGTEEYKSVLKAGLLGSTGITGDMTPISSQMTPIGKAMIESEGVLKKARALFEKADDVATQLYQGADNTAKYAAYKVFRKQGLTHEQSVRRVYDSFQNYSTVGKTWDFASKTPLLGNKFIKFQADLQRILLNAVTTSPLTTIGTLMMISLLGKATSALSGETEEEQKIRESRKGVAKIPLPFGMSVPLSFKIGKSEVNVARYLSPLYMYKYEDSDGDFAEMSKFLPFQVQKIERPQLNETGYAPAFGDPTYGFIASVIADRDFRGISIQNPDASKYHNPNITTQERILNVMNYVGRTQVPFYKSAQDMYDGITGNLDYYGRKRDWKQAILNNIVKVQQFDKPEIKSYIERNVDYLTNRFTALSARMGDANSSFLKTMKDAKDRGLTDDVLGKLYQREDKIRASRLQKSLDEQVPVMQELTRLTSAYQKWYPDDPFIQENFQNIQSGKNQRFNVLDDVDLQAKYKDEYTLLKSNNLLKKPIVPSYFNGRELTDEERKDYTSTYWSEYLRQLDMMVGLTPEEFADESKYTVKEEQSVTSPVPDKTSLLEMKASSAREIAKSIADFKLRSTIK